MGEETKGKQPEENFLLAHVELFLRKKGKESQGSTAKKEGRGNDIGISISQKIKADIRCCLWKRGGYTLKTNSSKG